MPRLRPLVARSRRLLTLSARLPSPLPRPRMPRQHIMIDLGTGNNNKINWAMNDKQEFVDIVEVVSRCYIAFFGCRGFVRAGGGDERQVPPPRPACQRCVTARQRCCCTSQILLLCRSWLW